jgi:hypothetical protein
MHGKGVYTWPDGRKFIGSYANDKKEGAGTFFWLNNSQLEGTWKAGKQEGIGIYTSSKGNVKKEFGSMDREFDGLRTREPHKPLAKNLVSEIGCFVPFGNRFSFSQPQILVKSKTGITSSLNLGLCQFAATI